MSQTPGTEDEVIAEQKLTATRIAVALVLDFGIAALALSIFRSTESIIRWYWPQDPKTLSDDISAAKSFVEAHGIPIVISNNTDGPFILGFYPLSYVFQTLHVALIVALGGYLIYDVIRISRMRRPR